MPRITVLGTGTHVGKTYVTAQLTRALAAQAGTISATGVKPIESGIAPSDFAPTASDGCASSDRCVGAMPHDSHDPHGPQLSRSDAQILAEASSPRFDLPRQAYAFSQAVSPHLAARQSGVTIDVSRVAAWVSAVERQAGRLRRRDDTAPCSQIARQTVPPGRHWLLVETAGAVFSPLGPTATNFTLARALDPAIWVLVAPDRLGVLHDLAATLSTMHHLGRSPDHVLLSRCPPGDASTGTNAAELRSLEIANVAAVIEAGGPVPSDFVQMLVDAIDRHRS